MARIGLIYEQSCNELKMRKITKVHNAEKVGEILIIISKSKWTSSDHIPKTHVCIFFFKKDQLSTQDPASIYCIVMKPGKYPRRIDTNNLRII